MSPILEKLRSIVTAQKLTESASVTHSSLEELQETLNDELKSVKDYLTKLPKLVVIYHALSGPLQSPEIETWATNLEKLVSLANEFEHLIMQILQSSVHADQQFDTLIEKFGNEEHSRPTSEYVREISNLAVFKQLAADATKLEKVDSELEKIESKTNWDLKDFVGSKCGVYKTINKIEVELIGNGLVLDALKGFIAFYLSAELIERQLSDYEEED